MRSLRVLWTGGRPATAAEVESHLRRELPGLVLARARDVATLRRRLREPWDVVLAGDGRRGAAPPAVLRELQARGLTIPVVLLSGEAIEAEIDELLRAAGASECVLRSAGDVERLPELLCDLAEPRDDALVRCEEREPEELHALEVRVAGLVHDLNSLLMAISGHGELAREGLLAPERARRSLDELLRAARRARHLVEQMRELGRPGERARTASGAGARRAVEEALNQLAPALPANVRVLRRWSASLPAVRVGECDLQRIVLNLTANAAEALRGRAGQIVLALEEVELDRDACAALGLAEAGVYARLSVQDDGGGMDPQTRARAFEPYFTTKAAPAGRGLGLSVVRGLVHARGGEVRIESVPGRGTRVFVWLPAATGGATAPTGSAARRMPARARGLGGARGAHG